MTDQSKGALSFFVGIFLWILSGVYGFFAGLGAVFYQTGLLKQVYLGTTVISVGNITWGGVGKTPLAEYLVKALKGHGKKVAVLMRGYKGAMSENQEFMNDEGKMLQQRLRDVPILIGPDRVKNAERFLENNNTDVFVLDDGFQHRRVKRDIDIVAIDATNPWGNGSLIPRGILREPLTSLSRADIIVLTKADLGNLNLDAIKRCVLKINPEALVVEAVHRPKIFIDIFTQQKESLSFIQGKDICVTCSIGNPQSFEKTLENFRANIQEKYHFMDHHHYTADDIHQIAGSCKQKEIEVIVTTAKDGVKLDNFKSDFEGIRVLCLDIDLAILQGKEEFFERINHIF